MTATTREADDLAEALSCLLPARPGRDVPELGDTAARTAQPPQRHGGSPAGRAPAARPPRPERPRIRAAVGRRRPGARRAAADRPRAGRAGSGGPEARRRDAAGGRGRGARGRRLHAYRPRRAPRRVRGARRHPRRLPADRGAPGPGRVLGRHRRGDPLVQGGRPAQPRDRGPRPVGATVPRAAAHRRGARSGPGRWLRRCPGLADMLAKLAEGIAVEGMESLMPVLLEGSGGMQSVLEVLPSHPLVVVVDPERVRARAHDLVATSAEFLEASWLGAAAGSAVPVDLQGVLGTRVLLDSRRAAGARPVRSTCPGGRSPRSPATPSWPSSPRRRTVSS